MGLREWRRRHIAQTSRRTSILQMGGLKRGNVLEVKCHPYSLFEYECNDPEQDIVWAILTVAFIQVSIA